MHVVADPAQNWQFEEYRKSPEVITQERRIVCQFELKSYFVTNMPFFHFVEFSS